MLWIYVLCGSIAVGLIHTLGILVVARLFGLRANECAFGIGPSVLRSAAGGMTLRLNLLPVGSYVKFPEEEFAHASRAARSSTSIAGSSAVFVAGVLLGGWIEPVTVWRNLAELAIHPRLHGAVLAHAFVAAYHRSVWQAEGLLLVSAAWFHLLPLPTFDAGRTLIFLLLPGRVDPPRWLSIADYVSVAIMLWLLICMLIALISA